MPFFTHPFIEGIDTEAMLKEYHPNEGGGNEGKGPEDFR
jgi:hypothetical protein